MRKMLIITGLIAVGLISFITSNNTYAASDYDNTVHLARPLMISNLAANREEDVSTTYMSIMEACSPSAYAAFTTVLSGENPLYSIAEQEQNTASSSLKNNRSVIISWRDNTDFTSLMWGDNGVTKYVASVDNHAIIMSLDNAGNYWCNYYNDGSSGNTTNFISTEVQDPLVTYVYRLFLTTYDPSYPAFYEGTDIPDTYTPPVAPETYYPRARYDYNGSTWMRAFDSNVDLCIPYDQASLPDDVLAPGAEAYICARNTDVNIIYTLKDSSGTVIDTKTLMARDSYEYDGLAPPNTYTLEMEYEYTPDISVRRYPLDAGVTLGKSVIEIDTSKGPISGLTEGRGCSESGGVRTCTTDSLTACFLMEAPFVDIPQCMENVNEVMRMLTFGSVSFIKGEVYTECRTLGTLGDWLDLQNKYVCPQVPKAVRDVVTPFITLALAMLIIMMITRIVNRSNN